MKNVIFAFIALTATVSQASDKSWNQKLESKLQSTCADTWCEGDYYYSFKANCDFGLQNVFKDKGACIVDFDMKSQGKVAQQGSCALAGYASEKEILNDVGALSNRFYQELTDCISAWEARAQGKL